MRFTTVGGSQVANDFSSLTPCFGKPKVGLEKVGGGCLGQGQLTVPQWVCGWWLLGGKVAPREHQAGGSVLSKHGSWSTEVDRSRGGGGVGTIKEQCKRGWPWVELFNSVVLVGGQNIKILD